MNSEVIDLINKITNFFGECGLKEKNELYEKWKLDGRPEICPFDIFDAYNIQKEFEERYNKEKE